MYERFYGLRERPFSLTPDPSYLYPSTVHREALSHLRYGIEGHAGFTVITGEIGCGKTTLLQTVLRSLDRQTSISRLMNTMLDARELIEAIMLDFGLEPGDGRSKPYLLRDLATYLVEQRNVGNLSLLIIDEAQNLSVSALEEVRMLSNLETEKSKLIQIVLIGQPNLRTLLARPELEQLRQRVTVNYHIEPLTADDTCAYINHRLRCASIGTPLTFSRDVTDVIYQNSRGVARTINVIADAILLYGYGADKHTVDLELASEVLGDLGLSLAPAPVATVVPAAPHQPPPSEPTPADIDNLDNLIVPIPSTRSPWTSAATPSSMPAAVTTASEETRGSRDSIDILRATDVPSRDTLRVTEIPAALEEPLPGVRISRPMPLRISPNHRILCELPPRAEGWWSRFRRGTFGMTKATSEG